MLVPSLFEGYLDDVATSIAVSSDAPPTALIVQDLIPHLHRSVYLDAPGVTAWYDDKLAQVRNADLLLAISEATKDDLVRNLDLPAASIVNIAARSSPGDCRPTGRRTFAPASG